MADNKIRTAPGHTSRSRRHLRSTLMLILLCGIWGLTFPATKAALEVTSPLHFLALRFSIAAVIMSIFFAFNRFRNLRKKQILPDTHAISPVGSTVLGSDAESLSNQKSATGFGNGIWLRGTIVGLFLLLGFALQVIGMKYTTASRSGFFTGLLVVITPIIALLFRTSKTHWLSWMGLIPAIIGVYFISDPGSGGLNLGDWLTIGCAFAFSMQMVVLEVVARKKDDVWRLTFVQVAVIGLGGIVISLILGQSFHMNLIGWGAVMYTAIFGSIIAVWMQTRFQPEVPAGHAAMLFTSEPIFASLFAFILLGETMTTSTIIGAAFVLSAMLTSSFGLVKLDKKLSTS
ncbi:DMT family transporter [bacterium]|nr:DMT family transporter [bacterium]